MSVLQFTHHAETDAALERTSFAEPVLASASAASGSGSSPEVATSVAPGTESYGTTHPAPLYRVAVNVRAMVETQDIYEASEIVGAALFDSPVRSLEICSVETPDGYVTPKLALHEHPAALAFHTLNNGRMILTGDTPDAVDIERATQLFAEASMHLGELHLQSIREQRYSQKVEEKNSELSLEILSLTNQLDEAHAIIRQLRDDAGAK